MDDFGRQLEQSLREALAYLDGELACQVHVYVRPRDVRGACGLTPSEMAERLGMDLDGYLAWEGRWVEVRDEWAFCEPTRAQSPAEQLTELITAKAKGE